MGRMNSGKGDSMNEDSRVWMCVACFRVHATGLWEIYVGNEALALIRIRACERMYSSSSLHCPFQKIGTSTNPSTLSGMFWGSNLNLNSLLRARRDLSGWWDGVNIPSLWRLGSQLLLSLQTVAYIPFLLLQPLVNNSTEKGRPGIP